MDNSLLFSMLEPYESILRTAVYSNYARCTREQFHSIMSIIYMGDADLKIKKTAYNCSRCKMRELVKAGKIYFDLKNSLSKNE